MKPDDAPSREAVRAQVEAQRAHDRLDGHEALCTERWGQSRKAQDELKDAINTMRTEVRDSIRALHDRLNAALAGEAADAKSTAAWWRTATFRWIGWAVGVAAMAALAAQNLK